MDNHILNMRASALLRVSPSCTITVRPQVHNFRCKFVSRKNYSVVVKADSLREPEKKPGTPGTHFLSNALRSAQSTWSQLDLQQRAFTVVAGLALLAAAPQLLTVGLIFLERLLVGALLALEEILAGALLAGTRLVVVVGFVALVATGAYLFLFKKESR